MVNRLNRLKGFHPYLRSFVFISVVVVAVSAADILLVVVVVVVVAATANIPAGSPPPRIRSARLSVSLQLKFLHFPTFFYSDLLLQVSLQLYSNWGGQNDPQGYFYFCLVLRKFEVSNTP